MQSISLLQSSLACWGSTLPPIPSKTMTTAPGAGATYETSKLLPWNWYRRRQLSPHALTYPACAGAAAHSGEAESPPAQKAYPLRSRMAPRSTPGFGEGSTPEATAAAEQAATATAGPIKRRLKVRLVGACQLHPAAHASQWRCPACRCAVQWGGGQTAALFVGATERSVADRCCPVSW